VVVKAGLSEENFKNQLMEKVADIELKRVEPNIEDCFMALMKN
jgi:hypothetical protein